MSTPAPQGIRKYLSGDESLRRGILRAIGRMPLAVFGEGPTLLTRYTRRLCLSVHGLPARAEAYARDHAPAFEGKEVKGEMETKWEEDPESRIEAVKGLADLCLRACDANLLPDRCVASARRTRAGRAVSKRPPAQRAQHARGRSMP